MKPMPQEKTQRQHFDFTPVRTHKDFISDMDKFFKTNSIMTRHEFERMFLAHMRRVGSKI